MAPRRARIGVSVVFLVCGAAFATWAARVPAAQERLGLTEGELALGLFGLAAGSVLALIGARALVTLIGSKRTSMVGSTVLCAGLPAVAAAPDLGLFVVALAVLGAGNSLLDVAMNAHAARVEHDYGRPIFAGFHAFWNIGSLAGSGLAAGWRPPTYRSACTSRSPPPSCSEWRWVRRPRSCPAPTRAQAGRPSPSPAAPSCRWA